MSRILVCLLFFLESIAAGAEVMTLEGKKDIAGFIRDWSATTKAVVTTEMKADLDMRIGKGGVKASIEEYPLLHIVVEPVPPFDYAIYINGKEYPRTKESRYGVPRGTFVSLRVIREKVKPCLWSGVVHKNQTVPCKL